MKHLTIISQLCFALLAFALSNAVQAGIRIHTTMSAESFYVGEEFTFEILVSGASKVKAEIADVSDGLQVKFLEQIKLPKKSGVDGQTIAIRYRMMPMAVGELHIPVFMVKADGVELMTSEEQFISVAKPDPYPGLELLRTLPKRDVYVGEPLSVDYQWKSPLPLMGFRAVELDLPLFYDSAFKVRSFHHWIDADDPAAIGLPVANTRVIARYSHFKQDGKMMHNVSFSKILIPRKPGEFHIEPASFLGSYVAPRGGRRNGAWRTSYPSYFNNNFFETIDGETYKKYYAASAAQILHVLPLPDAGKPDDFAGQIGKVSVQVTAVPKVVAAGDPITLTVVVKDIDFPEVMELPRLDQNIAFSRQFVIPTKLSRGQIEKHQKTFILTLRPRGQDVSVIPAVRIPYFDPKTKTYGVAESTPIPITVKAAETATAFDAQLSGGEALRNLLVENSEGIRANFSQLSPAYAGAHAKLFWMLAALLIPPLGLLVFLKMTARQRLSRRDPIAARALEALPRFRKKIHRLERQVDSLEPADFISQLDDAVRAYMAARFNLVQHAHTFDELAEVIQKQGSDGADIPDLSPVRRVYHAVDQKAYRAGGNSHSHETPLSRSDMKSLVAAVKATIFKLEKS